LDVARALLPPTSGAKSKYLGRGHFFPFLKKAHHQGDERK
jgi:hypothetical protein